VTYPLPSSPPHKPYPPIPLTRSYPLPPNFFHILTLTPYRFLSLSPPPLSLSIVYPSSTTTTIGNFPLGFTGEPHRRLPRLYCPNCFKVKTLNLSAFMLVSRQTKHFEYYKCDWKYKFCFSGSI
jgi:hypothetical protein